MFESITIRRLTDIGGIDFGLLAESLLSGECRGRTERFHALPDALRRVPATYKAL
jgi:hypothetical protein